MTDSAWGTVREDNTIITDYVAALKRVAELEAEAERLKAALWRAPEDWLKGDDEAWFALTGEHVSA